MIEPQPRHSARATPALQALTEADPALAALSLWCAHRDATGEGLAETEGTVIRYFEGFDALPRHEAIGLAGHHILHVGLQHSARMADMADRQGEQFDIELWQIATDSIINEALLLAGHALPRPALTLTKLLADATGTKISTVQALGEWDSDRLYLHLGGAEGRAERAKTHAREQGFQPDLKSQTAQDVASGRVGDDSGGAGEGAAEWRAHLARAMAAGAAAGVGIGVIGHRLADLPQPRTPWERVLRRLLLRAVLPQPRPSPHRPSRRWLAQAAMAEAANSDLPPWVAGSSRQDMQPRVVVGLDCSASIPQPALAMLMAETSGIARRVEAEIHLLAFDTKVQFEMRLVPGSWERQLRALALPQGGGTDFAPLIARADAIGASVLVVLSDLDGPMGDAPRFPVIWAALDGLRVRPAFGTVLDLSR